MEKQRTIIRALVLFCFLLSGCAMHGAWKESIDMLIGTKFDPELVRNKQTGILYTHSFNYAPIVYKKSFNPKDNKPPPYYYATYGEGGIFYYKMDIESPNKRYYIKWSGKCRYSLLVSPDNTILSWRYEDVANPGWDCVTS